MVRDKFYERIPIKFCGPSKCNHIQKKQKDVINSCPIVAHNENRLLVKTSRKLRQDKKQKTKNSWPKEAMKAYKHQQIFDSISILRFILQWNFNANYKCVLIYFITHCHLALLPYWGTGSLLHWVKVKLLSIKNHVCCISLCLFFFFGGGARTCLILS